MFLDISAYVGVSLERNITCNKDNPTIHRMPTHTHAIKLHPKSLSFYSNLYVIMSIFFPQHLAGSMTQRKIHTHIKCFGTQFNEYECFSFIPTVK